MKNLLFIICIILVLGIFAYYASSSNKNPHSSLSISPTIVPSETATNSAQALGTQTKQNGCIINGALPDKECTPGAIIPSATKDQVCQPGYSKNVRNVPDTEKQAVYSEYGIASRSPGEYEVDHFISLELGGSNDISNLWPEPASPTPGFHQKDQVENYLHAQVCNGTISLQKAQEEISTNWLDAYNAMGK